VANKLSGKNDMRYDGDASPPPGVTVPAYDAASDDAGNPLYKGVANTMPDGGFLGTFKQDVLNGKLPQVSWIVAPATYSEHPGPSSPVQGGWYIQEVLNALTASPEVWSKTVFIVNFDENDGYFDHMPSPVRALAQPLPTRRARPRARPRCRTPTWPSSATTTRWWAAAPCPPTAACTARARACRCMSSRLGAAAAGSTRRCSTTPRCCVFWKRVSV
jgi:hypothetical protein